MTIEYVCDLMCICVGISRRNYFKGEECKTREN